MASKTDIANLALSHLSVGDEIANLDTDKSERAAALRRFYDEARDTTLGAYPWPFATRMGALALVEEDPTEEWSYSYRYPSACMAFRRIISGIRQETRGTVIKYRIAGDDSGQLIYTDQEDAEGEWTAQVTDPERFPADFRLALSYYLAFLAAPRLTKGDQYKLGNRAYEAWNVTLARAQARAANEGVPDEPADSDFITVRG